jgi:hypothetical protein
VVVLLNLIENFFILSYVDQIKKKKNIVCT